jgi:two-component sensor histidine kinase
LSVTWDLVRGRDGGQVVLHWIEQGGPPVVPPSRLGFGSRLLRTGAAQLGGSVDVDYAPQGLRCRLTVGITTAEILDHSA